MLSFTEFMTEHFLNLIGDDPRKDDHAHEVHRMLTKAYAQAGGLSGNGVSSPEDLKKHIPFWKIKKNSTGKISAVMLYKDKNGRKAVAGASDGTKEGLHHFGDMIKSDFSKNRAYAEVSKRPLSFLKNNIPHGTIEKLALHHDQVKKLMPDDEIRPVQDDDPEVIRHPELKKHFYQRQIGGEWHTKLALGTPNKPITKD